ncbi:hypothetical protein LCGC14_3165650 [marine sediment metagenome]|uniref:Uncharacterized protein n=1 Tax=marine sediment metagenome TaxID=412755 RepID=A0A0F8XTS1_9ZZZZ
MDTTKITQNHTKLDGCVASATGECIAKNNNLIAAAPDLYKALKQIQKWLLFDGEVSEDELLNEQFIKANNLTVKALSAAEEK